MLATAQPALDHRRRCIAQRGGEPQLLLSGCYLLIVAGAGYCVRLFGGDWGRATQATLWSLRWCCWESCSPRHDPPRLRVFVSKHSSYRYDYRREWLRFTAALATGTTIFPFCSARSRSADLVEPGRMLVVRAADDKFRPQAGGAFRDRARGRHSDPANFLARTGW
jgi:hypothetical protein